MSNSGKKRSLLISTPVFLFVLIFCLWSDADAYLVDRTFPTVRESGIGYILSTGPSEETSGESTNPACMGLSNRFITFAATLFPSGITVDRISGSFPGMSLGPVKISIDLEHLSSGSLEGYDEIGNPTGSFNTGETAGAMVFSTFLGKNVSAGTSVGIVTSRVMEDEQSFMVFSTGLQGQWETVRFLNKPILLGMDLVVDGFDFTISGTECGSGCFSTGPQLISGISLTAANCFIGAEIVDSPGQKAEFGGGFEWVVTGVDTHDGMDFRLRCGIRSGGYYYSPITTMGMGIGYGKLFFNFAFVQNELPSMTYSASLSWLFDE